MFHVPVPLKLVDWSRSPLYPEDFFNHLPTAELGTPHGAWNSVTMDNRQRKAASKYQEYFTLMTKLCWTCTQKFNRLPFSC